MKPTSVAKSGVIHGSEVWKQEAKQIGSKEPLKAGGIADGLEDFEAGGSKFHSIYAYHSIHR